MSSFLLGGLAVAAFLLAALPAVLTLANLKLFTRAPEWNGAGEEHRNGAGVHPAGAVSVLVPARNEAATILRMATAVLASRGVALELVVLDDNSSDTTASLVAELSQADPRVRLVAGKPLAAGWCGKQHACAQLAEEARSNTLVFLDADVLLGPEALARSVAFLHQQQAGLVSGFPRQLTGSVLDWLLLPLIQFILLGFLPLGLSRRDGSPGLAAGCGQLFITDRESYRRAGGHAAISASLHDGLKLPRAYRRAGLRTDIFDASDLASCRMYSRNIDVLTGLAKNATEGIASPGTILPFTLLLAGGQVLPVLLFCQGLATGWQGWPVWGMAALAAAAICVWLPRLLEAARFGGGRGAFTSALAHPLAILIFLGIQWVAFVRRFLGLKTSWRGRPLQPQ